MPPIVAARDISLLAVRSESVAETVELSGSVRAAVSASVAARIAGTVSVLKVKEGDRVGRGQLLALLASRETAAAAAMAQAGMDEAIQALNEARARKRLAETTFGRFEKLYAEQAVTRQEYDVRNNERELAGQEVKRAEARLGQAREASRAATSVAGYARITAPVTGVVTARQVDLGSTVFPGQPLLTIENQQSYRLELTVPESLALKIRPGAAVRVSLDALERPWDARVGEIVPAADPASRTFIAKVHLNRPGVRSGLFGRGALELPERARAMLLPAGALVQRGGLSSVWVVSPDNRLVMRLIKVGRFVRDRVEILSGLQEGERVVVSGLNRVSEGAMVK